MRLMALVLGAAIVAGAASAPEHPGKIDWVMNPDFGFVKAKLEGRATMLYFTADW